MRRVAALLVLSSVACAAEPPESFADQETLTVRLSPTLPPDVAEESLNALDDWNQGPEGEPLHTLDVAVGSCAGADICFIVAEDCPFRPEGWDPGWDGGAKAACTVAWPGAERRVTIAYDAHAGATRVLSALRKLALHEVGHALGLDHDAGGVMRVGAAKPEISRANRVRLWSMYR